MYLVEHMSEEAAVALERFIENQPTQIVVQVHLATEGDRDKGTEYFTKMFMRVSDYARRNYGWIDKRLDSVEVIYKKRKIQDPNDMSSMLGIGGLDSGGGCGCGSCGR